MPRFTQKIYCDNCSSEEVITLPGECHCVCNMCKATTFVGEPTNTLERIIDLLFQEPEAHTHCLRCGSQELFAIIIDEEEAHMCCHDCSYLQ